MEYLASKISAGREGASPKTTWWFRHCHSIIRYLMSSAKGKPSGIEEIRKEALEIGEEWDRLFLPVTKGLMKAHATLELGLVDATCRQDVKEVESIGMLLIENFENQLRELTVNPNLPAAVLKRLLDEHVALFVERIEKDIENEEILECSRRFDSNAMALTDFTVEWF